MPEPSGPINAAVVPVSILKLTASKIFLVTTFDASSGEFGYLKLTLLKLKPRWNDMFLIRLAPANLSELEISGFLVIMLAMSVPSLAA